MTALPEVSRVAMERLAGTPLALRPEAISELEELLSYSEGEALVLETYGLVCVARWLHEANERDAAIQLMKIATTATVGLRAHNAEVATQAERTRRKTSEVLGTRHAGSQAPRFGDRPKEGSVSLQSLVAGHERKIT